MNSHKTTIVGAILAVQMGIAPSLRAHISPDYSWIIDLTIAGTTALAFYLTKDYNVSGTPSTVNNEPK